MIKKITFVILVCCSLVSCGKKGDPKYVEPEKSGKKTIVLINKV